AGGSGDRRGEYRQFNATGLQAGRRYTLSLTGPGGRALCEPWQLATFPGRDEQPQKARILFFTCAGGHEALTFLPTAVRNRLFRRALSFQPDAAAAHRGHVYLDQPSPFSGPLNTPPTSAPARGK